MTMKQQVRFFAIGLLTATLLIFAIYFMTDETDAHLENVPVEEMIEKVESEGYRVITEDEFISYSFYLEEKNQEEAENEEEAKDDKDKNNKKERNNKNEEEDEESDEEDETKDEVKKISFRVQEGFVSKDIADILEDNDIIDDSAEFVEYLEDNDYSPYLQLGTFEVTSDMNYKEIAETITTYPGD